MKNNKMKNLESFKINEDIIKAFKDSAVKVEELGEVFDKLGKDLRENYPDYDPKRDLFIRYMLRGEPKKKRISIKKENIILYCIIIFSVANMIFQLYQIYIQL